MRLTEAAYRVARKLGILLEGELSSASSTTVMADSVLLSAYGNDYFNRGTLWITIDAGGANAAPELQGRIVSDFAQSGGSVTVTPAFTASPAATDKYAIATAAYPLATLQMAVNQAMLNLGKIPFVDTSLSTAAAQTEYTLPAAVFANQLREVWIQGTTGDADNNAWIMVHDWYTAETGTGTADTLIFRNQPTTGRTIKLVYVDEGPLRGDILSTQTLANSAIIPETYPEDTLIAEAVVEGGPAGNKGPGVLAPAGTA